MAKLEYSLSALNVLKKFYKAKILVFCEGSDDLPFWRAVFSELCNCVVAVESLGGSAQLDKYARLIAEGGADLIVARDADYLVLTGKAIKHDRVIYTYGYSIENSLYVPMIVRKVAHLINRKEAPDEVGIIAWSEHFADTIKPLVIGDIASQVDGLGLAVLGDNCERYMCSKKSALISRDKVNLRMAELMEGIPNAAIEKVDHLLVANGGYDIRLVRGHVLSSAVVRFVAEHSNRNVSTETVFTNAINLFERQLTKDHPHSDYYREVVSRAVSYKVG